MLKYKTQLLKLPKLRPIIFILLLLVSISSCDDSDKIEAEISKIPIDLKLVRFDKEFNDVDPNELGALKGKYPFLFPTIYPDSIWQAKLADSLQQVLRASVNDEFSNFDTEKEALTSLYQHVAYYFKGYKIPSIYTVTNDVEYQNRVIATDSILFIGLDNYLGAEHEFYGGFPKYTSEGLDRAYLVSDVASAVGNTVTPGPKSRSFLAQMVYYGKLLYIKDKIIPFETDAKKIGYSEEQLDWVHANEEPMWRNFIENEYLYSTDNKLAARFLDPAPFSKFGLELIDIESPGRAGRFIGWQIVRAFMNKNEVSLEQMLNLSGEEIFKKSNYKPKK